MACAKSFIIPIKSETIQEVYEFLYKPGRYKDLWFYWDGKPLIIGHPDECSDEFVNFTIRQSQWPNEPPRDRVGHGWILNVPAGVEAAGWDWEVINVSVAQHPQISSEIRLFMGNCQSRQKFHDGQNDFARCRELGIQLFGTMGTGPGSGSEVVLVTGWNEWIAGRFMVRKSGGPFC